MENFNQRTAMIYRKCSNCNAQTPRGMFCPRCDAGIFTVSALMDMELDPVARVSIYDRMEKASVTHYTGMRKHGDAQNDKRVIGASKSIRAYLFKFDFESGQSIFQDALRSARRRTDDEIKNRNKTHDKTPAQMVAEAMAGNEFTE